MSHGAEMLAAMRDASWWRNPGRAGRYHVMIDGMGVCNPRTMLLVDDAAILAEEVAEALRCQRPGCKKRWPAAR